MCSVVSDIVDINLEKSFDNHNIETYLTEVYEDILRWAIIDVSETMLRVSITYLRKET